MSDNTNAVQSDVTFDRAAIAEAIESMAKKQEAASKSIAKVIVMAAWAANVEGDPGVANALFANLRKGVKKEAIAALLQAHCNLNYSSGAFKHFDAKKGWTVEEVKAIRTAAANWESFKKPAEPEKQLDAIEAFDDVVQKLMNRVAKGTKIGHQEVLPRLQALLGELKGEVLFEEEA